MVAPCPPPSVLIHRLVREGQREKKRGYVIASSPFNTFYLYLAEVMSQSNSFNQHAQITLWRTEQSRVTFALRLPTTQKVYSCLICFFFILALTSHFFFKTSFPFKWKASSKHFTNQRTPSRPPVASSHPPWPQEERAQDGKRVKQCCPSKSTGEAAWIHRGHPLPDGTGSYHLSEKSYLDTKHEMGKPAASISTSFSHSK